MDIKRIGIIRFSSIGDIILTVPTIHALGELYPNAEITLITKESFGELLTSMDELKGQLLLKKGESLGSIRGRVKEAKFDLIVDLHDNIRSHFITFFVGARVLRYSKNRLGRFLVKQFKLKKEVTPVWRRYLDTVAPDLLNPIFSYPIKAQGRVERLLPKERFLLIAPGSTWATKEWPLAHHKEFATLLSDNTDFPVILIGGDKDREVETLYKRSLGERFRGFAGELTIAESAYVVSRAEVLFTVDTGMMHIGSSLNKKMVVLFGSTVREFGFYPTTSNAEVVEVKLRCRPCSNTGLKACPKKHRNCMVMITPSQVLTKITEKMGNL